jgi:cytoskeleton protein RodZ
MSDSDNENKATRVDFGAVLKKARKSQNYSIEDVSEHIKIAPPILEALEAGDIDSLPAQAFTQGYIRSYARHLEIADDELLASYNSHFPDPAAEKLKMRPSVTAGASSRSPLVMAVTSLLIVVLVAAVIYGSISYYQEKADVLETTRDSVDVEEIGSSLNSPSSYSYTQDGSGTHLEIKQDAHLADDDSLILTDQAESQGQQSDEQAAVAEAAEADILDTESEVISQDVLKIYAEDGSWIEVRDANNERLLYNMIPSRGDRTIIGQAPFSITMGNARTTRITVNDLEIDLSDYIRPNNTANFSVSTEGQNIIFH